MSESKIEAIKEKLRKLIAKEESARDLGNLAEAESFAAKIQELIMLYEIEIDEVMGKSRVFSILNETFDTTPLMRPHESDWITKLYMSCGPAALCKVLGYKGKDANKVLIFGEEQQKEVLHFLVAQLIVKLRRLARVSFSTYDGMDKRNTYHRSFYKGACVAIGARLRVKPTVQQEYGIVLAADVRLDEAINKYMSDRNAKFVKTKSRAPGSKDAYQEGYRAGQDVGINKGVGGARPATKFLN